MDAARGKRIAFLVATPDDTAPVTACLQAGGHQLRVASDMQEARRLLAAGKADFVLCDAGAILGHALTGNGEGADLRVSVAGVVRNLRTISNTLAESVDQLLQLTSATPFGGGAEVLTGARKRIPRIEDFLGDLLPEMWNGAGQELRVADANLEDLVEGAAITVYGEASRKGQRLVLNIDGEATWVRADPAKLKRVLADLLANAVRHTSVAGTVTVEARREGSDCLITVSDSGEGISSHRVPQPFRSSETSDVGGPPEQTVLGLSVVRRLVDQHGGRVWMESGLGHGTTIVVALPQPAGWTKNRNRRTDLPDDGQEDHG